MKNNIVLALIMISMIFLSACGGSGGGGGAIQPEVNYTMTGVAIDPYIKGAIFYIDSNGNGTPDQGEPVSIPSDANGKFGFTAPVQNGDVIRMHPDNKGTHAGRAYTGELLERVMDGVITEDGSIVTTPLTTMLSKYGLNSEDMCEILNSSAGDTIFTTAHLFCDPLAVFAEDTVETSDFRAVQANTMINLFLSAAKDTQVLHTDMSALQSDELKERLSTIFQPIMTSVFNSLNKENYEKVIRLVEDQEVPQIEIQQYVYSCIEANSHIQEHIRTALDNDLHSDLSSFAVNLRDVITQDVEKSGEDILKKTLMDYISINSDELKQQNKYDSIVSNAGAATGDHDYFTSLVTQEETDLFTNYTYDGTIKNSLMFSKDAVFYVDGNNNGAFDQFEDSEDTLAFCDENGEFDFQETLKGGKIIRMLDDGMGNINGKTYAGIPFEREISPYITNEVMVVSAFTTIMSRYSIDSSEISAVLENISGNQGIFDSENVFSFYEIEDINAPTAEVELLRKKAIEAASLVMLEIIKEYPALDQALKEMTSSQVCQLLQGCLEPIAEKTIYIVDDALLNNLSGNIQTAYNLLNNPMNPFTFDFDDIPELDVELILRSVLSYREEISRIVNPAVQAIDLSVEPAVYIPQVINAFTTNIDAIGDLSQKTSDLLITYYLKEKYTLLNAEDMYSDLKTIISTLGNQIGFSALLDSIDESSVISIDSATGNIVVQ